MQQRYHGFFTISRGIFAEMKYLPRAISIAKQLRRTSVLLLGARRTGKSSLIRHELKPDRIYDLLESDTYQRLAARPSLIRESIRSGDKLIAVDEIQKLPVLMDEIHSLIETREMRFLLTGSSARKLMRSHTGLMAGRAKSMYLHPLTFHEIEDFDLERAMLSGTLPFIYGSDDPFSDLRGYASDYVREEVVAEGLSRKVQQFTRFLEVAALSHTLELNFEEIGRDAQVPARTVRDYFSILSDTLFGETLMPYRKRMARKPTAHGKFYFFDIAVPHGLLKVRDLIPGTQQYAASFEHLIYRELATYRDYAAPDLELNFYRDVSKREIDFLVEGRVGIEVKSGREVRDRDLKNLAEVGAELRLQRQIVVSREPHWRKLGNIEIFPVTEFLQHLWDGELL